MRTKAKKKVRKAPKEVTPVFGLETYDGGAVVTVKYGPNLPELYLLRIGKHGVRRARSADPVPHWGICRSLPFDEAGRILDITDE
jgi:hypothetical protein